MRLQYVVELHRAGQVVYESEEFNDRNEDGRSGLISGDGEYQVAIRCANEAFDCTYGRFLYKLVPCGCESDELVVLKGCQYTSFDSAVAATCGGNCDPGFYSDPVQGCTQCPNFRLISTSNLSYENLVGKEQCGVQGTTGFWSLAVRFTQIYR